MAIYKTRHFSSTHQRPKTPPDGTSLEEQMNAFLATKAIAAIADVSIDMGVARTGSAPLFIGLIVFQE